MSIDNNRIIYELCSFIPYFKNIDPDKACQWKGGEKLDDGVISLPYPEYDKEFMKFVDAFYKSGISVGDYKNELNLKIPNWKTVDIHKVIETADFDLLKVILTKCIRVERFCDGAWHGSIRDGLFLAILQRLNVLLVNNKVS